MQRQKQITQAAMARVIKACEASGLKTTEILATTDGAITFKVIREGERKSTKKGNDWDEVLEE